MDLEDMFGENSGLIILQLFILVLASVIIFLLFSERSINSDISNQLDKFKCPKCPKCPACNCVEGGCPDCVCPDSKACPVSPSCPKSPKCPECKTLTLADITDAIFPGRNKGVTTHGQYFPLSGLGEASVEPAYSPVTNLMPNYVGGDGVPASISFADQKLLSNKSSIGLATQKEQPVSLATTQGVFKVEKDKADKSKADKSKAEKDKKEKEKKDKKDKKEKDKKK